MQSSPSAKIRGWIFDVYPTDIGEMAVWIISEKGQRIKLTDKFNLNNNISAETVLCKCCPDSHLRIPDLNYNICEKRIGVVPKALKFVISKRLCYKKLKEETTHPKLKEIYDNRQIALKWIIVTCFGYLGYRNSKFGTIDGHIGVSPFG